jgi:hypothetical protein
LASDDGVTIDTYAPGRSGRLRLQRSCRPYFPAWRGDFGVKRPCRFLAVFHSIRVNNQWRLIFRWDGSRGEAEGVYLDDHSYR